MHFRCMLNMLKWCVLIGLDWAVPMMFFLLHVTRSSIFHAYVQFFFYLVDIKCAGTFLFVTLSFLFFQLIALWHLNGNLLRPGTLFVPRHLLLLPLLILFHLSSSSVMIKLVRTFEELFTTRHSFGTPSHSIGFFRY